VGGLLEAVEFPDTGEIPNTGEIPEAGALPAASGCPVAAMAAGIESAWTRFINMKSVSALDLSLLLWLHIF
jgi:hypothetical protein